MKKVAVIGCSHSDDCGNFQGRGYVWPLLMAKEYPHIQFDNYSKIGHGHLYFDMVLKHIISSNIHYDKIILQLTGDQRWFNPVASNNYYDSNFAPVPDFYPEADNLNKFTYTWPRQGQLNAKVLKNGEKFYGSKDCNLIPFDNEYYDQSKGNMPKSYTDLFLKTLHIYNPYFKIFTFNILEEALDDKWHGKYPSFQSSFKNQLSFANLLDDSLHLNQAGNRHLYNWLKENSLTIDF
jgi:hypothetical protein